MATRRRNSQYQYEPLVTPEKWTGDEQRFSQRLTQILDDLYTKFSSLRQSAQGDTADPEEIRKSLYPVGSCYTTSTNTNPAGVLGFGTWTEIDRFFAPYTNDEGFFTANADNASLSGQRVIRSGHDMRIYLAVKPSTALGETNVALGTLDFEALGITGLTNNQIVYGASDGGNGISAAQINNASGVLTHIERATTTSGGSLASGQNVLYEFVIHPTKGRMLDEACNQFVWKRTA